MLKRIQLDLGSIAHVVGGAVAALLSTKYAVLALCITILFIMYQYLDSQDEELSETKQDIVEYIVGLIVGGLILWAVS